MKDFNSSVAYLEDSDFDDKGHLINIPTKLPIVVMFQASWCGYCQRSKPAFETFAGESKQKVLAATVQIDGDRPSEKALGARLDVIKPDLKGFPDYGLYVFNKSEGYHELSDKEIGERTVEGLKSFANV